MKITELRTKRIYEGAELDAIEYDIMEEHGKPFIGENFIVYWEGDHKASFMLYGILGNTRHYRCLYVF